MWREYAQFQERRNRHKSAQKIYLRALVGDNDKDAAVADESDKNLLWDEFLSMMKKLKKDENLTLDKLRTAVQMEHVEARRMDSPIAKRPRVINDLQPILPNTGEETEDRVAVKLKDVELSSSNLLEFNENVLSLTSAEWLARDGSAHPSKPEPPLFSASPPKQIADPSFMDKIGSELAIKLIRLLLTKSTGNVILEIARGCWIMSALKEKEARVKVNALDKKLVSCDFY